MDMDVVGNKERLLKGILDGETTTDIEPVGHEEILLKAILENGGGGGGGSGEDFPVFELEEYQNTRCAIQMGDVDYIADEEKKRPFYIKGASGDLALCVYSTKLKTYFPFDCNVFIFNARNLMYLYLVTVQTDEKKYYFATQNGGNYSPVDPFLYYKEVYERTFGEGNTGDIAVKNIESGEWKSPQEWWNNAGIVYDSIHIEDLTDLEDSINQTIGAVKQYAAATPSVPVTKYYPLTGFAATTIRMIILSTNQEIIDTKKAVFASFNNTACIADVTQHDPDNQSGKFASYKYKEIDTTTDKIYDMSIILNWDKIYVQCTCHEATSLM